MMVAVALGAPPSRRPPRGPMRKAVLGSRLAEVMILRGLVPLDSSAQGRRVVGFGVLRDQRLDLRQLLWVASSFPQDFEDMDRPASLLWKPHIVDRFIAT